MPRVVRPEIQALIDSGACNWDSTIDLILPDVLDPIYLSSAEILYVPPGDDAPGGGGIGGEEGGDVIGGPGGLDVARQYLGKLDSVGDLAMSLDPETDQIEFSVGNADMVMGRTLTGQVNQLAGARGILGILFIDPRQQGVNYYDARMQGEIIAGEISDEEVRMTLIGDSDVVLIAGETFASLFPWREPLAARPVLTNPNDLPGRGGGAGPGGGDDGDYEPGRRFPGRHGDIEPLMPFGIV